MVDFNKGPKKFTRADLERRLKGGSTYDSIFKEKYSVFTPKEGPNNLRILPVPSDWTGDYYGHTLYVHYNIGPNDTAYLCAKRMNNTPCPICEAYDRAKASGDDDYARTLYPTRRVLFWIIDRNKKGDAVPELYAMSNTMDKDIADRCIDKSTGDWLDITDPDDGYDLSFTREGTGITTKYLGIDVARRSSPISSDPVLYEEWLTWAYSNFLTDAVQFYPYDHIKQVFSGAAVTATTEEQEEEAPDSVEPRRQSNGSSTSLASESSPVGASRPSRDDIRTRLASRRSEQE